MAMNKGVIIPASGQSREVAFVELTVCRASCAFGAVSRNRSLRPARISLLPPAQIAPAAAGAQSLLPAGSMEIARCGRRWKCVRCGRHAQARRLLRAPAAGAPGIIARSSRALRRPSRPRARRAEPAETAATRCSGLRPRRTTVPGAPAAPDLGCCRAALAAGPRRGARPRAHADGAPQSSRAPPSLLRGRVSSQRTSRSRSRRRRALWARRALLARGGVVARARRRRRRAGAPREAAREAGGRIAAAPRAARRRRGGGGAARRLLRRLRRRRARRAGARPPRRPRRALRPRDAGGHHRAHRPRARCSRSAQRRPRRMARTGCGTGWCGHASASPPASMSVPLPWLLDLAPLPLRGELPSAFWVWTCRRGMRVVATSAWPTLRRRAAALGPPRSPRVPAPVPPALMDRGGDEHLPTARRAQAGDLMREGSVLLGGVIFLMTRWRSPGSAARLWARLPRPPVARRPRPHRRCRPGAPAARSTRRVRTWAGGCGTGSRTRRWWRRSAFSRRCCGGCRSPPTSSSSSCSGSSCRTSATRRSPSADSSSARRRRAPTPTPRPTAARAPPARECAVLGATPPQGRRRADEPA